MQNTTENNKLIAQFMGKEWHKEFFKEVSIISPSNISYQFHDDWNWLMKAVEKVETISNDKQFYIIVEYDNRKEFKGWSYRIDQWLKTILTDDNKVSTKIEATYNACISFIKWYNLNKSL
jgi:hypothetical protein